ncbi:hypothetical protein MTR67_048382 [Solanum verrucosum]|uniref:Retrotransposon gag domain-containing protein n=1 Tax=Solanum verrucosum TaxID=315347 RepID=A0AAF0UYC1_SOLVR|nr:hypothetical protein MTR67_048382 [Solanum verrucosum]
MEKGSMTVSMYKERFHELSRQATMILPTTDERVCSIGRTKGAAKKDLEMRVATTGPIPGPRILMIRLDSAFSMSMVVVLLGEYHLQMFFTVVNWNTGHRFPVAQTDCSISKGSCIISTISTNSASSRDLGRSQDHRSRQLGMEWISPDPAVLDYFSKTVILAMPCIA